ncbi:MAG: DJ-1/PfpI family protein [Alphaproteobacteria bacterium]|jgi:protease I
MQSEKRLSGKKVAFIVANGFQETHMTETQRALTSEGAASMIISSEVGVVNGWHEGSWGHNFFVDSGLNKVLPSQYDALLVPGGERSMLTLSGNAHAKRIVKGMVDSGKPVAVVGRGVALLAAAECVAGVTVAGNEVVREQLTQAGAIWSEEPVAVDGSVLSSPGTNDELSDFIEALITSISGVTEAEQSEAA